LKPKLPNRAEVQSVTSAVLQLSTQLLLLLTRKNA